MVMVRIRTGGLVGDLDFDLGHGGVDGGGRSQRADHLDVLRVQLLDAGLDVVPHAQLGAVVDHVHRAFGGQVRHVGLVAVPRIVVRERLRQGRLEEVVEVRDGFAPQLVLLRPGVLIANQIFV